MNLLAFYHKCCDLIGYATGYPMIDNEQRKGDRQAQSNTSK